MFSKTRDRLNRIYLQDNEMMKFLAGPVVQSFSVLKYALPMLLALAAFSDVAVAFTDEEVLEIFQLLDTNRDGRVDSAEFANNKVMVIFRKQPKGDTIITFEETKVSREWFDKADTNQDGKLSGVEVLGALRFEVIDTRNKGYFTLKDLTRFLKTIGR